ncbi:hypothetical protein H5410_041263 [Solanum commersonii]|uniref:Uncharacterized protein n=1 Tax=Solanum commersonii TaxID=4109 RepID=A0A9J5XSH5_SOLCO|nr:hypothetical protein H5410_041263 [Solanum commersonii]
MIIKALFWIVRSVRTQHSFHRIQMLHKYHNFAIIALMEPFQEARNIHKYKRRLGMQYANYNINGKIWVFIQDHIQVGVLSDTEQQLTLQLNFQNSSESLITTIVYAKCDTQERLTLWNEIYSLSHNMNLPWIVGDRGLPVTPNEVEDIAFCVNSCDLLDINFKGSPFTWWNGKADNYAPLLLSFGGQQPHIRKPFKFLKFWVEEADFKDVVKRSWVAQENSDIFITIKQKMKNTKYALACWSKERFGDIFKQLIIREKIVRLKEEFFEENPTISNRIVLQSAQAELKRYLHFEEDEREEKETFAFKNHQRRWAMGRRE